MKISVIIPHVPAIPGANQCLTECVKSLQGYDELLVMINSANGFARTVNLGLQIATGDYLCVVNNDTYVISGTLRDLVDPLAVVVPKITPEPRDYMPRSFFCMPRWVYNLIGPYDERFKVGYFEDDDYIRRLNNAGIKIKYQEYVSVHHRNGGGMTMKFLGEQENFDRNQKIYQDKWKESK